MGLRRHGGLDFADLMDETGTIQLLVTRDEVGEETLHDFAALDLGDWVGVAGEVIAIEDRRAVGRRRARSSCCRRPCARCPISGTGLTDPEARYRRRYVDLVVNARAREVFRARSTAIAAVRQHAARPRLPRGRDAGAAGPGRRRSGETVPHPPQRARHRDVAADRARAAAQAAARRRHGPRLRDRPRLPQRGPRHAPQPRVHAARGLPGVRRLPRHDGADGDARLQSRARRQRHDRGQGRATARSTSDRRSAAPR